jgi:hypothetical protein
MTRLPIQRARRVQPPLPLNTEDELHRVCDECSVPSSLVSRTHPNPSNPIDTRHDLEECPVCCIDLSILESHAKEEHVRTCLESLGQSPSTFKGRYLVYTLKGSSPLVGSECVICFEEFQEGEKIARLECLCNYHRVCIRGWFAKNNLCPVHR